MTVRVERSADGLVVEIRLASGAENRATVELLRDLGDALQTLDEDSRCRCIVLSAEGTVFCAGADLNPEAGDADSADAAARAFYREAVRLFEARKPIVAAINGAAVGAGLGLALVADFRVASPAARFVANFARLGFHPGFGLTVTLPQLIGAQRAALMFLTSRRIKAETALQWGLVDELVAADELRAAARRLAAEIAENSPLGLIATRATLRAGLRDTVSAAIEIEYAEQRQLRATADHREGVRAVAERRPGRFLGR